MSHQSHHSLFSISPSENGYLSPIEEELDIQRPFHRFSFDDHDTPGVGAPHAFAAHASSSHVQVHPVMAEDERIKLMMQECGLSREECMASIQAEKAFSSPIQEWKKAINDGKSYVYDGKRITEYFQSSRDARTSPIVDVKMIGWIEEDKEKLTRNGRGATQLSDETISCMFATLSRIPGKFTEIIRKSSKHRHLATWIYCIIQLLAHHQNKPHENTFAICKEFSTYLLSNQMIDRQNQNVKLLPFVMRLAVYTKEENIITEVISTIQKFSPHIYDSGVEKLNELIATLKLPHVFPRVCPNVMFMRLATDILLAFEAKSAPDVDKFQQLARSSITADVKDIKAIQLPLVIHREVEKLLTEFALDSIIGIWRSSPVTIAYILAILSGNKQVFESVNAIVLGALIRDNCLMIGAGLIFALLCKTDISFSDEMRNPHILSQLIEYNISYAALINLPKVVLDYVNKSKNMYGKNVMDHISVLQDLYKG